MIQIGDRVAIKRPALSEDQQAYPYGTVTSVVDDETYVVELDFLEEEVEVKVRDLNLKGTRKRKN